MRSSCVDAGLIPPLVQLLNSTDQEVLLQTGRALGNICYDSRKWEFASLREHKVSGLWHRHISASYWTFQLHFLHFVGNAGFAIEGKNDLFNLTPLSSNFNSWVLCCVLLQSILALYISLSLSLSWRTLNVGSVLDTVGLHNTPQNLCCSNECRALSLISFFHLNSSYHYCTRQMFIIQK